MALKKFYLAAAAMAAIVTATPSEAQVRNPWNGMYVGLHGGYGWQDLKGTFNNATSLSALDLNGGIIGGQIGYNWQSDQFLLGLELDASTLANGGSTINIPAIPATLSGDMSHIASVRARLGWAINNWLLFGTIGWGYGEYKFTQNVPALAFQDRVRMHDNGLTYGGGIEWMPFYGVSLRAEYLRYDIGATRHIPPAFPGVLPGDRVGFDNIDVARAALNIKLSN
ncbi:outer membrane beta-barrel protein [Hyphomicrobium sp. D-2]|uniref:outer membrane protein n=1 Tax=Hyphomicrobium sp. D-2 TaxID=3041621 RepID=UPI0024577AAF|nr:outer membrane beta-barrel protein [Hyphomicrobium sp. D-2]MDH4982283.1 outer membrane beta-barrel protein [Hyphomicrobium sp. D-2]